MDDLFEEDDWFGDSSSTESSQSNTSQDEQVDIWGDSSEQVTNNENSGSKWNFLGESAKEDSTSKNSGSNWDFLSKSPESDEDNKSQDNNTNSGNNWDFLGKSSDNRSDKNESQGNGGRSNWNFISESTENQNSNNNNQSIDWGSSTENDDFSMQGNENNQQTNEEISSSEQIQSNLPKFVANLGYKQTALLGAGIFILIAIVIYVFSGIKVGNKGTVQTQGNNQEVESGNQGTSSGSNSSDIMLRMIGDNYDLNYGGDVLKSNGLVRKREKYLDNNQVVYRIQIEIELDTKTQTVDYFCNYATFSAVGDGDAVLVSYQIVQDGYISVNDIQK